MTDRRVQFDFAISFANGGGLQGEGFRLDIDSETINDTDLADLIVTDLRLLMVERVLITNKVYIDEPHKRADSTGSATTLVDLSHPIRDGMVTYPGLPAPRITTHMSREESKAHYENGVEFHIGAIEMVANTGTYLDAPSHRYPDGVDIASLPLQKLVGVPTVVVSSSAMTVGPEAFADVETWGKAVLIHTGWDRHFGTEGYLGGHPHLSEAGSKRLIEGGAVAVGIDSANIDNTSAGTRPAHSLLLAAGIPIVEHLTNLELLVGAVDIALTILPAPVVGLGTFPIRAVAQVRML